MDGIGPVRGPEPKVFLRAPIWQQNRQRRQPDHSSDPVDEPEEELETEDEGDSEETEVELHIDLEA